MACQSVLAAKATGAGPAVAASSLSGYGPSSLRSAYDLTSASEHHGSGEVVGIVDAYNNPDLARNLATYRKHFGLPACTTSSGCLRIVNQSGKAKPLPAGDADWGIEEANDLDMVSAICPRCRIVLVEAKAANVTDLGIAEDTAIAKGARFISNSWSGGEFVGQDAYNHYFNHPGDALVFAAGDYGYGPMYPTDTQYVTAVGGTKLTHKRSGKRAWTESVWGSASSADGTGSGCSALEAKPSWQRADDTSPTGCLNRTENDVAAVGDPSTGVTIYDTYDTGATYFTVGGTSVATPIITAIYALAGKPASGTYPASYLYRHTTDFYRVTSGTNGTCESDRQYLCHGDKGFGGYNGPAGLGTPKGTAAFSSKSVDPVTVLDPGTQDGGAGAGFSLTVRAADNDGKAKSLAYTESGLPAGLTIKSAAKSLNATIAGTLPATVPADGQGYAVTVTAKDTRTGRTASTRFEIYVVGSLTTAAGIGPGSGQLEAGAGGSYSEPCLSAAATTAGTAVVMESCGDSSVSQDWQYFSGAEPGSAGSVQIATGVCLALSGGDAVLAGCDGSASQDWEVSPTTSSAGEPVSYLYNPASNKCLNGGGLTTAGQPAVASACSTAYGEDWALDVAVASGLTGQCMSAGASAADSAACASSDGAEYWQTYGGVFSGANGCLAESGMLDGGAAGYESCAGVIDSADGYWVPGPGGELINLNSGRCLDNPGSGEDLVQEDCYGLPGEIWALN
jgi:Ricin-type beta-trefoil lectin domain